MKLSNDIVPSDDYLLIGKIIGMHGIRGNVKVYYYADTPDIFEIDRSFLVVDARGKHHSHTICWVKPHKRNLLMAFHGIRDRGAAEALLQAEIYVPKSDLPSLEAGTYYWFQLEGLSVIDADGEILGRIDSVMATGSNDVYVVKDEKRGDAYEVLIPALASVVRSVDLQKGVMTVDMPEGL